MVDVVRFGNNNYKKCCGNCKWYQKCNYMCTNPDKYDFKTNYFSNRKYYRKAYVPSDYGCKYFSFIPNTVYDKKDIDVKVVDAAILDGDKYILFSFIHIYLLFRFVAAFFIFFISFILVFIYYKSLGSKGPKL